MEKESFQMKKILATVLVLSLLLSLAVVGASALSSNVTADTWSTVELKALYVQSGADIYSDLNEDYLEFWWEDEVPESNDEWLMACTINMRGFAMSPDGRYLYMGTLNGGTGVRGVVVYDTQKCVVTDLYYHFDGEEAGLPGSPYSYAKGIAADDRGYVYVGFAFSQNYNLVNLGIAQQMEDGSLEEVALEAVYEFGDPGDTGGIKVGVNGVDVAKVGDKYYCYVMVNYDYDALYCFDVTDPASPKLNEDFGDNGLINFSDDANPIKADGFTLKEGQYMDVDDDGTIWLVVNANEGKDGIMKIAPDGSACVDLVELSGIYSVEHEGGFLLCGLKSGASVEILDDASYEKLASVPLTAEYGDRVVRMQVVNDVLFVCDAGADTTNFNAIHAAPLSADGQVFFDQLVANLSQSGDGETEVATEETTEPAAEETEAPTEEATEAPDDGTEAPTDAATKAPDDQVTEPAADEGCSSVLSVSAVLTMLVTAVAAAFVRKKD